MTYWFAIVMGAALFTLMIPIVYRIWVGPTEFDRILGVSVIGTKTAVILVIIGTVYDRWRCSWTLPWLTPCSTSSRRSWSPVTSTARFP